MSKLQKLSSFGERLAELNETERSISQRHIAAGERLAELHDALDRAMLDGKVGIDWTTADEDVVKLHGEIAKVEPIADPKRLTGQREKLHLDRQKVESEAHKFAVEHLPALTAELGKEADALTALFSEWWTGTTAVAYSEIAERHAELAAAYSVVERAADLGRHTSTRLDIPPLPISITGDLSARFVPYTQTDPTIRSAPIPTA